MLKPKEIWFRYGLLTMLLLSVIHQLTYSQAYWESRSSLPVHTDRAVAFSIGDYGYVGTGIVQNTPINNFWRYNPAMDSWTEIDSIPTRGRYGAFSFTINNRGYVGGGQDKENHTDEEFWEYDPETSTWTQKNSIPYRSIPKRFMTAFSVGNRGFLIFGNFQDNFFMYHPDYNYWYKRARFPGEAVMNMTGFSIGNKGYVGTGFGNSRSTPEFWEYDLVKDQWSRKADFPSPRIGAVSFSIGNRGYIGMGLMPGDFYLDDFYEYKQENDSWSMTENIGYIAWDPIAMTIGSVGYVGTGSQFTSDPSFWAYIPNPTSVEEIEASHKVNVYPNPASDYIHVDMADNNFIICKIYSPSGDLDLESILKDGYLSIKSLLPGLYILTIQTENQVTYSTKFIKY